MKHSTPIWIKLTGAALLLYCTVVLGTVYRYNQAILSKADYAEITGGGFIYNYRIADIRSGITVGLQKPLPLGTRLVAEFENPAGGTISIEKAVSHARRTYSFETPSLSGVEAQHSYAAVLRVIDPHTGREIERHEKVLKSTVVPKAMPSKPLTIGPGYFPNPDLTPGPKGKFR
ncbi:hypothetical protein [Roseibium aggregatum]|uniref:Uncharacterized protein n=1 Tax=Roseibium aggregatum TaxID=187304 RepID=A0A939J2D0_9HYPH|nr:hypothetical protein [Roseibium aggregatum]MBN9671293.1 hypothetical protein [Roseibium aggregatum]